MKSSKKNTSDMRILNTTCLKTLEIKELATKCSQVPAIDVAKVERRLHDAKLERNQAIERIGVNVPPEAQRLFNAIYKTYVEICCSSCKIHPIPVLLCLLLVVIHAKS